MTDINSITAPIIEWIAYCVTCQKELERCLNGHFTEGAARHHRRNHMGHQVLVGYEYHPPEYYEPMRIKP